METEFIETVPYGLYKNHQKRRERIIRVTTTLVVTEFGRYDRKTGINIDITNKSIGGYRLSEGSRKIVNSK